MLVYQKVNYDHHLCRTVPYCTLKLLRANHFEYSYMWILIPNSMDRKTIHNLHLLAPSAFGNPWWLKNYGGLGPPSRTRGVLACLMLARYVCLTCNPGGSWRNTAVFLSPPHVGPLDVPVLLDLQKYTWCNMMQHDATWCNLEMGSGKNRKKQKKLHTVSILVSWKPMSKSISSL